MTGRVGVASPDGAGRAAVTDLTAVTDLRAATGSLPTGLSAARHRADTA
jgi:hypothetical protein